MQTFWMVLRDGSNYYSQKRHYNKAEAVDEAIRLSKKEGNRFFVMKAVVHVEPGEPTDPTVMQFRKAGEIPDFS